MLRLSSDERGSVSAEMAVAMPVVIAMLALICSVAAGQIERIRLAELASLAARAEAIGEDPPVADGVTFSKPIASQGDSCVVASASLILPVVGRGLRVSERSCSRVLGQ